MLWIATLVSNQEYVLVRPLWIGSIDGLRYAVCAKLTSLQASWQTNCEKLFMGLNICTQNLSSQDFLSRLRYLLRQQKLINSELTSICEMLSKEDSV